MIWLLPLLIIGAIAASAKSDDAEREFYERKVAEEQARLDAALKAKAAADAAAKAAKEQGDQYLAMKPTVAGRGELRDLNGENPRNL